MQATSTDTGQLHGPRLPDWGSGEFRRYIRLCKCGAVETGWPHSWHGSDCVRFNLDRVVNEAPW